MFTSVPCYLNRSQLTPWNTDWTRKSLRPWGPQLATAMLGEGVTHEPGQEPHVVGDGWERLVEAFFSSLSLCSIIMHPHKDLLVSCGEDRVWKMVGLPKGNVLLTGLGHTDWLSNCCFHPRSVHTALRASLISPGMHLFTLCLHSAVFFFFFF